MGRWHDGRAGSTPRGELFNEVGDRLADVLMLAPVAFVPGAHAATVLLGVTIAVLASFTSVAIKAAGGTRGATAGSSRSRAGWSS